MSENDQPVAAADPVAASPPAKESRRAAIWRETKGLGWVLLAVLAFHSFIAKPFYIPSESMMPQLLIGDRLIVTKYPYGWSYVSPTIPNPAAIVRDLTMHSNEPWGITLPFMKGRVFGHLPKRGDVVIVTPPGSNQDYIKRVIGLPGDTVELRNGKLILNGVPVKEEQRPPLRVPIDRNMLCGQSPADPDPVLMNQIVTGADGRQYCELPIVRETLPSGPSYNTIDLGPSAADNYGPQKISAGHVFLMGDNRDRSADSRVPAALLGLGGPVPWENIGGRAEFITFSLDGSGFLGFRGGRMGTSLHPDMASGTAK